MADPRLASLDVLYDKLDASFEASGISMRGLADAAGVAPATAKRVMSRQDVRWTSFDKVCRALGYKPVLKIGNKVARVDIDTGAVKVDRVDTDQDDTGVVETGGSDE